MEINKTTVTTSTAGATQSTPSTPSTPIDRSNEKLIDNATTFNALLRILASNPEVLANAEAEAQEREAEEKEARLRKTYGDDYDLVFDKKKANEKLSIMTGMGTDKNTANNGSNKSTANKSRRPGAIQLRTYVPRVAMIKIGENGICEVFNNGYAVYDNGDRKTVIWVPDCGTAKYYFATGTDEITKDEMGEFPWFNAVLIAGEDSIQYNMEHPKTQASTSDSDIDDVKPAASWAGATRFPNPEEAYLRKEAAEERKKALSGKQREAYELYYEQGYTQREIAENLGINHRAVGKRIRYGNEVFKGEPEKYFSNF